MINVKGLKSQKQKQKVNFDSHIK